MIGLLEALKVIKMKEERIITDYFIITVSDEGKNINIQLQNGVKCNRHHNDLLRYVEYLYKSGVDSIRADHIDLPYFHKNINLKRGNRRLDIVYYIDGRIYECEFKTKREIGLDITYSQLKQQQQFCENLILLCPRSEMEYAQHCLNVLGITGVTVDCWDCV